MTDSQIIESIILDFSARVSACQEVTGYVRDVFLPFAVNGSGKVLTGDELYILLKDRWVRELTASEHEFQEQLKEIKKRHAELQGKR